MHPTTMISLLIIAISCNTYIWCVDCKVYIMKHILVFK